MPGITTDDMTMTELAFGTEYEDEQRERDVRMGGLRETVAAAESWLLTMSTTFIERTSDFELEALKKRGEDILFRFNLYKKGPDVSPNRYSTTSPLLSTESIIEKYRYRVKPTPILQPEVVDATPEVVEATEVVDTNSGAFLLLSRIVYPIRSTSSTSTFTFWFNSPILSVEKLAYEPSSLALALRKTTDPPN